VLAGVPPPGELLSKLVFVLYDFHRIGSGKAVLGSGITVVFHRFDVRGDRCQR
jgi:hypothetical protein